jgi:hypothetical protein
MNKMNTVLEKESIAVTGKPLGFMGLDTKLYQAEQHSIYDPIYNSTATRRIRYHNFLWVVTSAFQV